ncbi:MAG TPA: FliA/WhiG family RNA polymerase sigma factor [Planctomycetota bacterium]|nr:FliA/WhiG family RNA polymerase sigma factor [Planctomycetota bacterium]
MRTGQATLPRSRADRDRLVEQYLPLVRHVVSRMAIRWPNGMTSDDFFSAGVLGLMHAATTFDAARGASFKTFAYTAIRGAILDEVRRLDPVPRSRRERLRELDRAAERLRSRLDRAPLLEELAAELGVSVDELSEDLVALHTTHLLSLDAGEDGAPGLGLQLGCPTTPQPVDVAERNERIERLTRAIAELPETDRKVVVLYHYENLYLKEIGEIIGVTESRVCQILARAHARLQGKLAEAR